MKSTRISINQLSVIAAERPVAALTAWDHYSGSLAEAAGADIVLVGDSLAMTVRGEPDTLAVTLDEMIYHSKQVVAACPGALVIGDMPFMSYQVDEAQALTNAGRFVKEAGVQAVKIEGGKEMAPTVAKIVGAGIPVLGHIGLRPQSVHVTGLRAQGKTLSEAQAIVDDAIALERSGCFGLVLECLPRELAGAITQNTRLLTIGIGAGPDCNGQIQVTADLLGMSPDDPPKHARKYVAGYELSVKAMRDYIQQTRDRDFPGDENCFTHGADVADSLSFAPGDS